MLVAYGNATGKVFLNGNLSKTGLNLEPRRLNNQTEEVSTRLGVSGDSF